MRWGAVGIPSLHRSIPIISDLPMPRKYSCSVGVWEFDWVQWAGSIQHPLARNIGQVIGVNAGLFSWASGVPAPSDKNKVFHSSIDVTSLTTLEISHAACLRLGGRPSSRHQSGTGSPRQRPVPRQQG